MKFHLLALALALTLGVAGPSRPARQHSPPFSPATPVSGVVVDDKGTPLPDVRYWASGFERQNGDTWELTHFTGETRVHTTGRDGRFEVPGRVGVRCDITFDSRGFAPAEKRALEPGTELRVVLRKGKTVSGRVVQSDGEMESPVVGTGVVIQRANPRGPWFTSRRRTDDTGRFEFTNFLPPDEDDPAWELVYGGVAVPLTAGRGKDTYDVLFSVHVTK